MPKTYIQNASLEITKVKVIYNNDRSITGKNIYPFLTKNHEGFDINNKFDLEILKKMENESGDRAEYRTIMSTVLLQEMLPRNE